MNERIKQLLLESGFKIFGDKIVAGDFGSSGNATLCSQKFAELIVRECAQLARDTDLEDVEGGDGEVLRAAKRQILQHFEVKE